MHAFILDEALALRLRVEQLNAETAHDPSLGYESEDEYPDARPRRARAGRAPPRGGVMTDRIGRADYELGADTDELRRDLAGAEKQIRSSGRAAESAFGRQAARGIDKAEKSTNRLVGRLSRRRQRRYSAKSRHWLPPLSS